MPPKPDPQIAEPSVGYAEVVRRPAKTDAPPPSAEHKAFLNEALEELDDLEEYAAELNMPAPDPAAKAAARAFLHEVVRAVPRSYSVSPWDKGTVIVYTQGKRGYRADIFFDADGSASCFILHPRNKETDIRQYSPAAKVANKRVFDALREIKD